MPLDASFWMYTANNKPAPVVTTVSPPLPPPKPASTPTPLSKLTPSSQVLGSKVKNQPQVSKRKKFTPDQQKCPTILESNAEKNQKHISAKIIRIEEPDDIKIEKQVQLRRQLDLKVKMARVIAEEKARVEKKVEDKLRNEEEEFQRKKKLAEQQAVELAKAPHINQNAEKLDKEQTRALLLPKNDEKPAQPTAVSVDNSVSRVTTNSRLAAQVRPIFDVLALSPPSKRREWIPIYVGLAFLCLALALMFMGPQFILGVTVLCVAGLFLGIGGGKILYDELQYNKAVKNAHDLAVSSPSVREPRVKGNTPAVLLAPTAMASIQDNSNKPTLNADTKSVAASSIQRLAKVDEGLRDAGLRLSL